MNCRRKKRGKLTALAFEINAEKHLPDLTRELVERTYHPSPSFCFVAKNDKHREVFAADFRDRVVHHLLVRHLEKIWEPVFIHDSYACRKGKGTHAAVERLQSFARKATANETRRAFFCQLDILAFFPSIDRRILLDIVCSRLKNEELRWLSRTIILHDPTGDSVFTCSRHKWRKVLSHKSLFSVPPGKGLPIGNLTSQFFANVYLNALDQFVKHDLKARWYMRYVDDLILIHHDRGTLCEWKNRIQKFLKKTLKLLLHPDRQIIRPVSNGINFLGYIVRPSHLLVRRRVAAKCKQSLSRQIRQMGCNEADTHALAFPPDKYEKLFFTLNSYLGTFSHASCHCLAECIFERNLELKALFIRKGFKTEKRWGPPERPLNFRKQYRFFRKRFSGRVIVQVGCYLELYNGDAVWAAKNLGLKRIPPRKGFYERCGVNIIRLNSLVAKLKGESVLYVFQSGLMETRLARRCAMKEVFAIL